MDEINKGTTEQAKSGEQEGGYDTLGRTRETQRAQD